MTRRSLRTRLIIIILAPLLMISGVAATWQFWTATERAQNIFDRGLLSAALAISRDVAVSDGDALSPSTRRLVNNTSGGELFYHVFAPDGVFVTGYATPPVLPRSRPDSPGTPVFFDAQYQEKDVRVLRFQDVTTVSDISGLYTITVWQDAAVRAAFVRDEILRAVAVILLLVTSVALVVWYGVGLGLRPLLDLETAIAKRTASDLTPIRRAVPEEVQGLVSTLNALLDRVSRRISSKDEFIANAAHQLRNPVAGVLALAEAVRNAPDEAVMRKRSAELVDAARTTSHLTNQLLSFERAAGSDVTHKTEFGLVETIKQTSDRFEAQATAANISVQHDFPEGDMKIHGDQIMLQEVLLNLMNNSVAHGGRGLKQITLTLTCQNECVELIVADDGVGIPSDRQVMALSRFGQANNGPGSGLGLAIAARVMSNHGGALQLLDSDGGATIKLTLPLASSARSSS